MSDMMGRIPIPPRGQVSIGVHYEVTVFGATVDLVLRRLDPVTVADLVHALLAAASYVCAQNGIIDVEEQSDVLRDQWQRILGEGMYPEEELPNDAN